MKFLLLAVPFCLLGVSCERHEFDGPDGTRQLHEHHHGAGDHGSGYHGAEGHGEETHHEEGH